MSSSTIMSLWLLLLPFLFNASGFEPVKVKYFFIGGIVLIISVITDIYKKRLVLRAPDNVFLIFLSWSAVVTVYQQGLTPMISGGDFRHQGVLFFLLIWLIGLWLRYQTDNFTSVFKKLIIASAIAECIYVFYEYIFLHAWKIYSYKGPMGTLGEPNATAAFIIFGLLFIDSKFATSKKTGIYIIVFVSLLLLHSLTGIAMFCTILLSQVLKKIFLTVLVCGFIFISTIVLYVVPTPKNKPDTRYWIWHEAVQVIQKKPIVGYGLDSQGFQMLGLSVERSHNIFIDISTWTGIVGLGLFLWWLYKGVHEKKNVLGLSVWLLFASFHPLSVVHWLYLFYFLYI